MNHCLFSSITQGVRRISALLVCVLLSFVFIVPVKVKAEALPIPPVWLPINPYNIEGLQPNYQLLSDDQKKIVREILGLGMSGFMAFARNPLQSTLDTIQDVRVWWQECGDEFLNTYFNTLWSSDTRNTQAINDFVGSAIQKSSTYETYDDYASDTSPSASASVHKYLMFNPELTVAYKNWFAVHGNIFDWQKQTTPFSTNFSWRTTSVDNVQQLRYDEKLLTLPYSNNIQANSTYSSYYNVRVSLPWEHLNMFLNTTSALVYLCDDSGIPINSFYGLNFIIIHDYDHAPYIYDYNDTSFNVFSRSFSLYDNTSYLTIARDCFNSFSTPEKTLCFGYYSGDFLYINPNSYVRKVYVGADWAHKDELFNIDDLNIGASPSAYIDNVGDTAFIDVNGFLGDLTDTTDVREAFEDNTLVKDGDNAIPFADSILRAIDRYLTEPQSGVVISSDFFHSLTTPDGPISYLWFMTKPLVAYTGDLLGLLTFESDGTFQFTGLGYIVVGIVSVGIIGGLVTKCLL